MPVYRAPVRDTQFILHDVLNVKPSTDLPPYAEMSRDTIEAILQEGAKLAEQTLFPINYSGDREGCEHQPDGAVNVPQGFKAAYDQYCAGGWVGLAAPQDYGGQGLPYLLHTAAGEYMSSANMALMMYPGLTQGAIAAILTHGSDAQKNAYLPKMIEGRWSGTMNLTEPHCGTDLGLLRTKAVLQADGSYKITGSKIFISAGEHEMTENIIHLVLARIEGAPEGSKGISLFIVPKFILDSKGDIKTRNKVTCGSIEEKMGIHGNATCVMNYDDATGFLIGGENKGLRAMFTMMNEARLGVALQGLSIAETAYQNAADYARQRLQGRALTGAQDPDKPADPIIVHPDIRRNLMTIRAFTEAGRALLLSTALQVDIAHHAQDEAVRQAADDEVGLLTPVLKGVLTDKGFDHAVMAQQVFGGHGYIEENGMSQYVRDARITMIYEGANGIQALDLVGRKLPANNGRALMAYFKQIGDFCEANRSDEALSFYTKHLKKGLNDLQSASMWLMQNALAKPDNAGAASSDYMHLFGLVAFGYMWAKMAKAAQEKLKASDGDKAYYAAKLVTARFYMERIMPETQLRLARIQSGADTMMELPAEAF